MVARECVRRQKEYCKLMERTHTIIIESIEEVDKVWEREKMASKFCAGRSKVKAAITVNINDAMWNAPTRLEWRPYNPQPDEKKENVDDGRRIIHLPPRHGVARAS